MKSYTPRSIPGLQNTPHYKLLREQVSGYQPSTGLPLKPLCTPVYRHHVESNLEYTHPTIPNVFWHLTLNESLTDTDQSCLLGDRRGVEVVQWHDRKQTIPI